MDGPGLTIDNTGILQGAVRVSQSDNTVSLNNTGRWQLPGSGSEPVSHTGGGIVNSGTAGSHTLNVGSSGLTNRGTIVLAGESKIVGNQLTIEGDYRGQGGGCFQYRAQ
ncbi:hypothetical protein U9Z90_22215 [Escherichia fergusonii]